MSTASAVPETHGELEGDDALETLRGTGWRRLAADSITRFRYADGFSHSRALALQATLTLLPALIAVVGLAAALDQETFTRVVTAIVGDIAPGAAGEILTEALRHGDASVRRESGETALAAGFLAALFAGATAMAQIERGSNRIYGVERDRPFLRKYAVAMVLTLSSGIGALLSLVVLVGGQAIRHEVGWADALDSVWAVARWPLGLALAVSSVALLLTMSPHRRQPEWSWLAFGAAVSAFLWLVFMGFLKLYIEATGNFGATYGPIAGTIGVLLWSFAAAVALFVGVAFSAQLEAARAGVEAPRVDRDANRLPATDGVEEGT